MNIENFKVNFNKYHFLLLIVLCLFLYSQTLFFDFIYDDIPYILNNARLHNFNFCQSTLFFIPGYITDSVYTPLTFIFLALLLKLSHGSALIFHLAAVIIYICSVIALYFFLLRTYKNSYVPFFASVLYAVHPCHVECTAWIAAIGYNIAAAFAFFAFYLLADIIDRPNPLKYCLMVISFLCAVLSQPAASVFPVLILLWTYCFRNKSLFRGLKLSILPFLISGIYIYMFWLTVSHSFRFSSFFKFSVFNKLAAAGQYLMNCILPWNLMPLYPVPDNLYILLLVVILLFASWFVFLKKSLTAFFCCLWYVLTMLPYSNLFYDTIALINDRYLLFPSVPICIAVSCLLIEFGKILEKKSLWKNVKYLPAVFVFLFYIVSSFIYIPAWKNNDAFWVFAYFKNPDNLYTASSYGIFCLKNKKYDEAVNIAGLMIEKYPTFYEGYELKINSLMATGRINEAYEICRSLSVNIPEYYKTYIYMSDLDFIYGNYKECRKNIESAKILAEKYNKYDLEKFAISSRLFMLEYVECDVDKMVENFKIMSDNFNSSAKSFIAILSDGSLKDREGALLSYLSSAQSEYNTYAVRFLHALRLKRLYGDKSRELLADNYKKLKSAEDSLTQKDEKKAELIWLDIVNSDPYMLEAEINLAFMYYRQEKYSESKKYFTKAYECDPSNKDIRCYLDKLTGLLER